MKIKNEGMLNIFLIYFYSVDIVYFLFLCLDLYRVEVKNVLVEGLDICIFGVFFGILIFFIIYKYIFFNLKKKINILNLLFMCFVCEEYVY